MSDQAPVLDPKRTALLVMDFQQDVLQRMPGLEPLVARVQGAIADMRDHGGTIGYVRVAFTEEDWAAIPPGNSIFARAAQNRMMHHEDPSTAIHDSLAPQPGDIVVRKTRVGAMSTTDLDRQLRDRGIDTLVLAGISTSGVVLSTRHRGNRPRLPSLRLVRRHRGSRRTGSRCPAGPDLPEAGPDHRHRHAARAPVAVDSRP